jgi:hypothetical protein
MFENRFEYQMCKSIVKKEISIREKQQKLTLTKNSNR